MRVMFMLVGQKRSKRNKRKEASGKRKKIFSKYKRKGKMEKPDQKENNEATIKDFSPKIQGEIMKLKTSLREKLLLVKYRYYEILHLDTTKLNEEELKEVVKLKLKFLMEHIKKEVK